MMPNCPFIAHVYRGRGGLLYIFRTVSSILAPVFLFAQLIKTSLYAIWAEHHTLLAAGPQKPQTLTASKTNYKKLGPKI